MHELTGQLDAIVRRNRRSQLSHDGSVHPNVPRGDERFGAAPGRHAGIREEFLQPHLPIFAECERIHSGGRPPFTSAVKRSWTAQMRAAPFEEAQRSAGFLGNADPCARSDIARRFVRRFEPQRAAAAQVHAVVLPAQTEGLRQPSWTRAEFASTGTPGPHDVESGERLSRTDEHRTPDALDFARNVQAIVHAVNEVYVGEAGRPEHRCIARRPSAKRVRCRIVRKIRLRLDDPRA